ncbi:HAD family hydrolase [Gehongia tenuis]|uniref:HAD family hydrolase n=1 Tax=Gehongia tenuis TaxID=2763655 RepID=A0A926D3Y6_9FIRM|nr:HAD family hydrolase [Gehongia tenuis]MBC8531955.1 HAD family hydrolase [Gehongia tenuis]
MKALWFDLDGTLLPVDLDFFMEHYLHDISAYAKDLVDPKAAPEMIMRSTYAMIGNMDPAVTNEAAFAADFEKRSGCAWTRLKPLFDVYYRDEFPKLGTRIEMDGWAERIVAAAKAKGYKLVVATNPLFPRDAIEARLHWVGLDPADFLLVTTYEVMHFCKPHLAYYEEIASMTGLCPADCMMIGNDNREDMVASKLGMKTYFVTNNAITHGEPIRADHEGSREELVAFIEALPMAD